MIENYYSLFLYEIYFDFHFYDIIKNMKKIDIYTTEIIFNEQGIPCKVIDISKLDFTKCAKGRKSKITLVKIAKGGEKIFTFGNDGKIESTTIAKMGDAIFCNSATDVYIPADKN